MKPIVITFTKGEASAMLHRLSLWDNFAEVFADSEGFEHLAHAAPARAHVLHNALEGNKSGALTVQDDELDKEVLIEAIEGSTWVAVNEAESDAKGVAAYRVLCAAAKKIEAAYALQPGTITVPTC